MSRGRLGGREAAKSGTQACLGGWSAPRERGSDSASAAFAVGTGADRSTAASGCRSVAEPPPATVRSRPGDAVTLITLLVVALVVALALVYRRVWRPPAGVRMPGDGLSGRAD